MVRLYRADNRVDGYFFHLAPRLKEAVVDRPPGPPTVAAEPAEAAYRAVLSDAGAFPRDPFDRRIVKQVRERKGHIVKQPGLIDDPEPGAPYADADGDGMDDLWEAEHGADPRKADPWADADGDGLANLDQFLDQRARARMAGVAP